MLWPAQEDGLFSWWWFWRTVGSWKVENQGNEWSGSECYDSHDNRMQCTVLLLFWTRNQTISYDSRNRRCNCKVYKEKLSWKTTSDKLVRWRTSAQFWDNKIYNSAAKGKWIWDYIPYNNQWLLVDKGNDRLSPAWIFRSFLPNHYRWNWCQVWRS